MIHTLPFGKHRGQPLPDVPSHYLRWAVREMTSISRGLRRAIEAELSRRDAPPKRQPLQVVSSAAPNPTVGMTEEDADLSEPINRAHACLDWFTDNLTTIRHRLTAGEWEPGKPLDLETVVAVTAAARTAAVLLDPDRIGKRGGMLREQRATA